MNDLTFLVQQTQRDKVSCCPFWPRCPPDVLTASPPEYGQGSILSTLTHVVDCYGGWIESSLLEEHWALAERPDDLPALTARFTRADALLERALTCPRMDSGARFDCVDIAGNRRQVTARWLVLHPTTHEVHHEGQVVTLLRKLGHPVTVDLDLPPPGGW